ncbi:MAG: RNA polymerase sigma-70 factor [Bacteroidales bacterium]
MFDQLASDLKNGSMKAFEEIYLKYLNKVIHFAYHYLMDMNKAKCVAHDVFLSLWENRGLINEEGNLQSYILTTTKNKCINILKHNILETKYSASSDKILRKLNLEALNDASADLLLTNEFMRKLGDSLSKLPEKTQEAFILNRFNHYSYEEISKKQAVSVKNIEYRMMQALKLLRRDLIEFFPLLLGLLATGLYSICQIIL